MVVCVLRQRVLLLFVMIAVASPQTVVATVNNRPADESTDTAQGGPVGLVQDVENDSEEEQHARVANERFLSLLKKQPKPGTALDRVFAFYEDRGTLDEFLTEQRALMTADDDDGIASLLVGLIETKRGNHSEAEQAFQLADQRRPKDANASWLLGKSLLELQKPDAAAVALERAIERAPQKADLLLVFQDLGRAYRRSRQTEKANAVWQRIESQFPDDLRVKEQIASTLLAEGDLEAAVVRYEQLAVLHRDLYQKTQYSITAADLKLQLGRRDDALRDLEKQLQTLDAESWLARDIRRRIDQSFLRNNDQAGLVTYYETWLQSHPDDLEIMASLGHALALQGRNADALNWYRKAVEKAPSNVALRRELLTLLTREKLFDEAIAEYEKLQQLDPENLQHLEDWGLLTLHRDDQPLPERRANAIVIWKRMLQDRTDDPGTLVQVAELIRRTEQPDEVLPLYRRAVELKQADPQYREYLGDYLQTLGRTDEAIQVWQAIAEGDQRTTPNLIRLAEIFRAASLQDNAILTMQAACELTPEFHDHLKLTQWLREYELDGRYPKAVEALKQLDIAETLAESDEERASILAERIQCLMAAGQLDQAIRDLKLRLQKAEDAGVVDIAADDPKKNVAEWAKLAAYLEAAKQFPEAITAAKTSTQLAPEAIGPWTLTARLLEQSGRYADAVEAYQKLVSLDQRAQSEYLQKIASLQQRLGRREAALLAGKELLSFGPENPDFVKFYADLCFHFGERQEALKTLRRAVSSSSADGTLILSLARTLANQNEVEEATALCWMAFEKTADADDKSSTVMMLAELALRSNRFDQLIEKLEQLGRVPEQQRESALCLATAFRVAGDLRSARRSLETLLTSDSRDSQLLLQLSRLAEEDGDLEAAADFQRRTNSVTPSDEGQSRLASLLMKLGDLSEAEALWTRIAGDTANPADIVDAIDQLMDLESIDSARDICDRVLMKSPENWEVLVRRGILEWRYGDRSTADKFFQRLLDLKLSSDSTLTAATNSTSEANVAGYQSERLPTLIRLEAVPELAGVFSEESASSWFGPQPIQVMPNDYGAARIVAVIGRYLAAKQLKSESAFLEQLAKNAATGELQAACDLQAAEMFLAGRSEDLLFDETDFQRFILAAQSGDIEAQALLLELFALQINVWEVQETIESSIDEEDSRFISGDQFLLLMTSFENVLNHRPEWLETFDAARLFAICRHQRQLEVLDSLIARLMQQTESSQHLSVGLDLSLLRQSVSVDEALETLSQIAGALRVEHPRPTNSLFVDEMADFEWYAERLLKIARMQQATANVSVRLKTLDWWLRYRHEIRQQTASQVDFSSARKVAQASIDSVVGTRDKDGAGFQSSGPGNPFGSAFVLGVKNRFTEEECEFLTQIYALFVQENAEATLEEWYRTLADSSEDKAIEIELLRAVLADLRENQEQVLLHLVRAASKAPDDILLKLTVISRLESLKMKPEALELTIQLPDNDPTILKFREIKTLELAKELRLTEQAKNAAIRLAGLELDDSEQTYLMRELRQLGLPELLAQFETRQTKVAFETPQSSPLALLDHYEQKGDLSAAVQVAQQLLRRSHQNTTPWRNTTRPTPEQIKARAFRVLRETGELEKMIERQKSQLAKSPQSGRLQKTLLDYLQAAGKIAEADELRASWQRNQPGLSAKVRMDEAQELIEAKQNDKACDKLLEIMQEHPSEFWNEAPDVQLFSVFTDAGRLPELADAVLSVDRGRIQSYAPTETLEKLIKLLLKDPKTHAKAAEMIQRYSEMYPAYTVSFLMLVEQLPLWSSSPDLFALLTRMYVPSTAEQLQRPQLAWPQDYEEHRVQLGFDPTALSGGGNLKRLWDALKFSDERRLELEQSTKDAMVTLPEWSAGPVILIVCALSVPEKALDQDRIETLVNEMCEDSKPAIPEAVAHNLTQLLRQRGERMKRAAVKLLETSLKAVPEKELNLCRGASIALLDLYSELNEPKRGLEFLRRSVLESSTMDRDDQNCDAREYLSRLVAGYFFRVYDRPLTALQVLHGLAPEHDARISRFGNLEAQRANAIERITVDHILEALKLAVAAEAGRPVTAINLPTTLSLATDLSYQRPVCALIASIVANSNPDVNKVRELSAELATSLKGKHPDLSLIVLGTAMVLKSNDQESIDKVLPALEEYNDRGGLTDMSPNETAGDFSRRQNALISLAALASVSSSPEPSLTSMARLVEQSLACARLKGDREIVVAILHQLQRLHQAGGDQSAVERIQKELQSEQDSAATPSPPKDSPTTADRAQLAEQLKAELRKSLLKPSP